MGVWEQVLLGMAAIAILIFFGPGVSRAIKNSPKGTASDWRGALIPLALVVLFVVVLISFVR